MLKLIFFGQPSRSRHELLHSGSTSFEASPRYGDGGIGDLNAKPAPRDNLTSSPSDMDMDTNATTAAASCPRQSISDGGGGGEEEDDEPCFSALADELLWREIGHWKPSDVIRQFCAQHPSWTLPIISGLSFSYFVALAEWNVVSVVWIYSYSFNVNCHGTIFLLNGIPPIIWGEGI